MVDSPTSGLFSRTDLFEEEGESVTTLSSHFFCVTHQMHCTMKGVFLDGRDSVLTSAVLDILICVQ